MEHKTTCLSRFLDLSVPSWYRVQCKKHFELRFMYLVLSNTGNSTISDLKESKVKFSARFGKFVKEFDIVQNTMDLLVGQVCWWVQ